VFAFARDGYAYTIYPNGIRQQDWAVDLPKLARDASGETIRAELAAMERSIGGGTPSPETGVTMRGLEVPVAVIAQPLTRSEAALYLTVKNGTPQDDELVAISSPVAGMASIHDSFSSGKMASIANAPIPHGGELRLEPGARHGMLMGLTKDLKSGDTVFVTLTLKRAGALEVAAVVVPYAAVQQALSGKAR
jgi:copper(I)-binding protein